MSSIAALFLLVVLGLIALLLVSVLRRGLSPVSRKRIGQFVSRTGVPLTAGNADVVLDGLARTVRWRVAGLLLAGSVSLVVVVYSFALTGSATVGSWTAVVLAVGFLAGAVVGEVGNAVRRGHGPRSASLDVRRERDYVGAWAWRGPLVVVVASVALGAVLAVRTRAWQDVVPLVAGAVVPWLVARWATRVILERPRPASSALDVVAADDGLRSRGLHAIGGPVVLVGSWSVASLVLALAVDLGATEGAVALLFAIALAVLARVAWVLAVRPFDVSGRAAAEGLVAVEEVS